MENRYKNRREAGKVLAADLQRYAGKKNVLVLALPRGGVPVAYEVAMALHAPLDIFLVRKLGVPGHEELAMGAIATGGVRVINEDVVQSLHIPEHVIEAVTAKEQREIKRRERFYRDERPLPEIRDHQLILIDDGLATGASMRAAAHALRQQQPARLVVAVPVAAPATCELLRPDVDEIVCPLLPEFFYGVGWWYEDFAQTSDKEVQDLLTRSQQQRHSTV
jgi:putative phosphoribosyl transferase